MAKLTPKQWDKLRARLMEGEKLSVLAKEFKISRQAITKKIGCSTAEIKDVAKQIVSAEIRLKKLPVSSQLVACNYADKLRTMLHFSTDAATNGAIIASRLTSIAVMHADDIDEGFDIEDEIHQKTAKTISVLTDLSNKANESASRLIVSFREQMHDEERANKIQQLTLDAIAEASPEVAMKIAQKISELNNKINQE